MQDATILGLAGLGPSSAVREIYAQAGHDFWCDQKYCRIDLWTFLIALSNVKDGVVDSVELGWKREGVEGAPIEYITTLILEHENGSIAMYICAMVKRYN